MEEVWRPRRINGKTDWTTGNGRNRVMLDSDVSLILCLVNDRMTYVHMICSYHVHVYSLEVYSTNFFILSSLFYSTKTDMPCI